MARSSSITSSKPARAGLILFTLALALLYVLPLTAGQITAETRAEDVFKELKVNDAASGTAVFTLDTKSAQEIQKDALTFTFNEVCGKVKSYKVLVTEPCLKTRPVYTIKETCEDNPKNGTKTCYNTETLERYDEYWATCEVQVKSLAAGSSDYKLVADIEHANCGDGWGYKIDWIPHITLNDKTFTQSKWAWWNASLDTGLLGYWQINEGSGNVTADSLGVYEGKLMAPAWNTTGILNKSLQFDGSTQRLINLTHMGELPTNHTINMWYWHATTNPSARETLISNSNEKVLPGKYKYVLRFTSDSDGKLQLASYDGTFTGGTTAADWATGQWVMITLSISGNTGRVYINNGTNPHITLTLKNVTQNWFGFGGHIYSTIQNPFKGLIDEIGIWGRNLTTAERVLLYNGGAGLPYGIYAPTTLEFNLRFAPNVTEWTEADYHIGILKDPILYDTLGVRFWSNGYYYTPLANSTNATHYLYNYSRLVPNGTGTYQFKWVVNYSLAGNASQENTSLQSQNITAYAHNYTQGIPPMAIEWDNVTYELSIQRAHATANITAGLYWNGTVYAPSYTTSNATAYLFEYSKIIPIGTPTLGIYWVVNHTYLGTIQFNTTLENQSYINFSVTPNLIYNSTLYETDPNNITIALPKHDTATISALSLTWDDTDQGSPDLNTTNTTHFLFTYTIPMPLYLSGVKNFTFNYTYSYISQTFTNTTSANQTVTAWGLFYCDGSTYNTTAIQFTTLDENTLGNISMPIYGYISYYRLVPSLMKHFYVSFNESGYTYLSLNSSVTDTANLAETSTAVSLTTDFMVKVQSIISGIKVYVNAYAGFTGEIREGSCSGTVLASASGSRTSAGVLTIAYDVPSYLSVLQPGTTYCLKLTRDYGSGRLSYNGLVTYDGVIGSVYAQYIPSGKGAGGVTWTQVDSIYVETGLNNTRVCIAPADLELYADGELTTEKAIVRSYYLLNASISAAVTDLQLFNMADSSNTSVVKLILVDDTYSLLSDVYVKMLRYYPSTNSWRLIGMALTDTFGRTYQELRQLDTKYKFIFQDYTTVLDTTTGITFYCPTLGECTVTFIIDTSEASDGWFEDFSYAYNESTKIFTLTWNDATGVTSSIRLLAYTETTDGRRVWCDTTTASASGSIECNLTSSVGTVIVTGYRVASPVKVLFTHIIDSISKSLTDMFESYGYRTEGMFMAALVGGVILTLGAFSAVTMILTVPIAFLVFWILGLANFINLTFFILSAIAALILGALMGRRGE